MALKTNYKDAMYDGARKYRITENADGTSGIADATNYTQAGDQFGANDINETNAAVNNLTDVELPELKKSVSDGKALVAAAITAKRVTTAATETFAQMAANIAKIILGSGNAAKADVLAGKTFTNDDGVEYAGTMADKSGTLQSASANLDATNGRVQMAIPATGKYSTTSKLYATYASIRTLIGLTAAKIAAGNTILGLEGAYKGLGDATADNVLVNKKFSTATLSNAVGTMPNIGAVDVSLNPGDAYTIAKGCHNGNGKVKAKGQYVKSISAVAIRGFGAASGDYDPGPHEESFTMPEAGVVYYSGMSASYNQARNVVCEIYKNGIVVDHRNINSDFVYNWRTTMYNKSFPAAKGDVIVVRAAATSSTHAMATISAAIVYSM